MGVKPSSYVMMTQRFGKEFQAPTVRITGLDSYEFQEPNQVFIKRTGTVKEDTFNFADSEVDSSKFDNKLQS